MMNTYAKDKTRRAIGPQTGNLSNKSPCLFGNSTDFP